MPWSRDYTAELAPDRFAGAGNEAMKKAMTNGEQAKASACFL
jgi:hypothetical protein